MTEYLDDLESRIDGAAEEQLAQEWTAFLDGAFHGDLFSPRRPPGSPPAVEWPSVRINQALAEPRQMLLQQLGGCSNVLANGTGHLLSVRCNYGSSILPSLFGVDLFVMDDEYNTLPTSRPVAGGIDGIRRLLDRGMPDLNQGLGSRVLEMGRFFLDAMADYPKMSRHVHVFHPDLQGPMDVCEVIWGSGLFLDIVDHPQLVKDFLELVADTYIAYLNRWLSLVPFQGDVSCHWAMLHKGHIMLRDDSAMNFSPDMFREFIAPYNQRLLREFGGGADHFCGRGDHYIDQLTDLDGLRAINLSQPECNDMETVFRNTVDKGVHLLGLQRAAAEDALANGRELRGRVHCW